jgi:hypothetical protein
MSGKLAESSAGVNEAVIHRALPARVLHEQRSNEIQQTHA